MPKVRLVGPRGDGMTFAPIESRKAPTLDSAMKGWPNSLET